MTNARQGRPPLVVAVQRRDSRRERKYARLKPSPRCVGKRRNPSLSLVVRFFLLPTRLT